MVIAFGCLPSVYGKTILLKMLHNLVVDHRGNDLKLTRKFSCCLDSIAPEGVLQMPRRKGVCGFV